jgi:hypothetical protein
MLRFLNTARSDAHDRVTEISTTAVAKPNTIRQTTISQGLAKEASPVMISGKEPQIR